MFKYFNKLLKKIYLYIRKLKISENDVLNIENPYIEAINKKHWLPLINKKNYLIDLYTESKVKSNSLKYHNFPKLLRFYSLFQLVNITLENSNDKFENFVECGCWHGQSTYGISEILKKNNFNKKFYIFDSFEEGLSNREENDMSLVHNMSIEDIKNEKKYFSSKKENVALLLNKFDFIDITQCWIPNGFDKVKNEKFQFIHIDLDLFQPTIDTLNFFYEKLCKGGIIVCDDYDSSHFPGATKAINIFLKKEKYSFFYKVPLGGCFIIK